MPEQFIAYGTEQRKLRLVESLDGREPGTSTGRITKTVAQEQTGADPWHFGAGLSAFRPDPQRRRL
ncbi:hypothetical protein D3C76_1025430 [compost metagenome]